MWKVIADYKVNMAGLTFVRPRMLIARVAPDGVETPLLSLERGEEGHLHISAQFLNREGDIFGHVSNGRAPVPSALLSITCNQERWRITRKDSGALVCAVERSWGLELATLDVSFNMWILGRPIKILPLSSNVPEIIPNPRELLTDCGLKFRLGVTVEAQDRMVPAGGFDTSK